MPDKDGDDEKTTKGVVKKKTKQMLNQEYIPEEDYDHYRDRILMRGGDHRSKETRERSYTPTGKQPKGDTPMQKEFKKKYGKKATALDAVKQKYKGQIMNVGKKSKKKANEELDLTKIAEAFGGYILEGKEDQAKMGSGIGALNPKKSNKQNKKVEVTSDADRKKDLTNPVIKAKQQAKKDIGSDFKSGAYSGDIELDDSPNPNIINPSKVKVTFDPSKIDPKFAAAKKAKETKAMRATRKAAEKQFIDTSTKALVDIEKEPGGAEPNIKRAVRKFQKQQGTDPDAPSTQLKGFTKEKLFRKGQEDATGDEGEFLDKEGKPAPKKLKPATRRKSTAIPPAFATKQGETGPLPVSMRNRRVPKTSSLSPNVKVTSIVKPTVGSLARTDQETSAITKGGIDYKALQDKIKTVSLGKGMEVVDEPKTRTQGGRIGQDTGRTVDTTAFEVQPDQLTGSKPRQRALLEPPKGVDPYELLKLKNFKTTKTEPEPQPEPEKERRSETIRSNPTDRSGNKPPRKPPRVTTGRGGKGRPFKDFATSLVSLVRDNPVASLITYDQLKSGQNPFAIRGGRVGSRSAPS